MVRTTSSGVWGRLGVGLAVGLVGLLVSCGKQTQAPTPGTFTAVYTNTLSSACIQCHVPTGAVYSAGGGNVKLDFSTQATAYTTLIGVKVAGTSTVGTCGDNFLVVASGATKSYLAAVLFDDYSTANFGGQSGCTPYAVHHQDQHLSADEKASMVKWITDGALNN